MGCANGGQRTDYSNEQAVRKCCEKTLRSAMTVRKTSHRYSRISSRSMTAVLPTEDIEELDSNASTDSEHTLFLFDWDDTLFPRTWEQEIVDKGCLEEKKKEVRGRYEKDLCDLQSQLANILEVAGKLGHVVLVTNAMRGWVPACCERLMPELAGLLSNIRIEYAMEYLTEFEKQGRKTRELLTEAKARAMLAVVSEFDERCHGQSAQNIVSIGDGRYERDAIKWVAQHRSRTNEAAAGCLTKTVKMFDRPSLTSITAQLSVLSSWLPHIVECDSSINVDFGGWKQPKA